MIMDVVYDLIRSPVITEKSTYINSLNKYSFKVSCSATKDQVKRAVEQIFDVKVLGVNISNVRGKVKNFKGQEGKRSGYKKAIVSIKEGQKIDFVVGV